MVEEEKETMWVGAAGEEERTGGAGDGGDLGGPYRSEKGFWILS